MYTYLQYRYTVLKSSKMARLASLVLLSPFLCHGLPLLQKPSVPSLNDLAGVPFPVISCFPEDPTRTICPGAYPGITPEQCLDQGCCFSATFTYDWCFKSAAAPSAGWSSYNGTVERYAADQAIPAFASALGSGHVSPDGDIAAVTCVSVPPLTGVCDNGASDGLGFPYGLSFDGEAAVVGLTTQWFPFQVRT